MERLWDVVERENIKVRYESLTSEAEGIHGLYLFDDVIGHLVLLDKQLQYARRLHKCVLAHEIGHFYTSPRTNILTVHDSNNLKITENQDERKAMQWACDFLIADRELDKAFAYGCCSCYELAEYFDVTEWFVHRKLGFLKRCYRKLGWKVKARDIFEVRMQPCNLIS